MDQSRVFKLENVHQISGIPNIWSERRPHIVLCQRIYNFKQFIVSKIFIAFIEQLAPFYHYLDDAINLIKLVGVGSF
jgi:hypothetical protein